MDIKEVAHKIRYWLTFHTNDIDRDIMYEALEVMDTAIEEGENYKKIVEEIDERLIPGKVSIVECPDHTNMGELSTLEFIRLIIKDIKEKYFPKPKKEREEVLILTIKGKPHEVNNVIFNIEHVFRNSAHVNVKRGTKAENVQKS